MQNSTSMGFASVPSMLQSWLEARTGTVQVQAGGPMGGVGRLGRIETEAPIGEPDNGFENKGWCGRRDSDPGFLRGRQVSYQARLQPRASRNVGGLY